MLQTFQVDGSNGKNKTIINRTNEPERNSNIFRHYMSWTLQVLAAKSHDTEPLNVIASCCLRSSSETCAKVGRSTRRTFQLHLVVSGCMGCFQYKNDKMCNTETRLNLSYLYRSRLRVQTESRKRVSISAAMIWQRWFRWALGWR